MKIVLTDTGIVELYSLWSEETYSAGFIGASPEHVQNFRGWLIDTLTPEFYYPFEDYEQTMLDEFHRQEMEEAPLDHDQS